MNELSNLKNSVILFDGICNLCSGSVQFVIRKDKHQFFRYASLQSQFGLTVLQHFFLTNQNLQSVVLLEKEKIYTKSTAALRIAKQLIFPWNLLYICIIIPAFIRNGLYNLIAPNRYHWFGKKDTCYLPQKEIAHLFFT